MVRSLRTKTNGQVTSAVACVTLKEAPTLLSQEPASLRWVDDVQHDDELQHQSLKSTHPDSK